MPYLTTDDQGLPKPQYESENGASFEPLKGKEGAAFSYVKDGNNVALGAKGDPESETTLIGLTKALKTLTTSVKDSTAAMKLKIDNLPGKADLVTVPTVTPLYGALSVETTAKELRIGGVLLAGRKSVRIFNVGEEPFYVGYSNAVTVETGLPVWPKGNESFTHPAGISLFVVAAAAGLARIMEV